MSNINKNNEETAGIYQRISELCASKGISGAKMCADIGVSRQLLTELKSGRSKTISLTTAQKIAEYFDITVESLFAPPEGVEVVQDELFEKRKLLFDLSSKATEEDLDKFIKMLNVMLGEE